MSRKLKKFFAEVEKQILINIENNWDNISFKFQLPKILEPLVKMHDDYLDLLNTELAPIYEYGKIIANRRLEYAEYKSKNSSIAIKANRGRFRHIEGENITKFRWKKTEGKQLENNYLFGTNENVSTELGKNNFKASTSTLERVDQNINNVLKTHYENGDGIPETKKGIQKAFDSLKGYESERIARTEIHTAQELGIQQEYRNLGVKYRQWITHIDEKTRTSHTEINEQIIPMDGMFSNGLKYPGDKAGALKEWINCRCRDIPYIPPAGKMFPPGQQYYTESDLIDDPTYKDYIKEFSVDDLLNGNYKKQLGESLGLETTEILEEVTEQRLQQLIETFTPQIEDIPNLKNIMKNLPENEWQALVNKYGELQEKQILEGISSLTAKERKLIRILDKEFGGNSELRVMRNRYINFRQLLDPDLSEEILQDMQDIDPEIVLKQLGFKKEDLKHYSNIYKKWKTDEYYNLRALRDSESNFLKIMEKTGASKDVKWYKEIDLDRLTPYERKRYETLLKLKKNNSLRFNEKELAKYEERIKDINIFTKRSKLDLKNGKYSNPKTDAKIENFIEYHFHGKNYTVFYSEGMSTDNITLDRIIKYLEKNPILEDSYKNLILSSQKNIWNGQHYVGGWSDMKGNVVTFEDSSWGRLKQTIAHEGGHNIDELDKHSGSKLYQKLCEIDHKQRRNGTIKITKPKNGHLNKQNTNRIWISKYAETKRYYGRNDYIEDWAESVCAYLEDPKWFKQNYPNRYKYIDDLFKHYKRPANINKLWNNNATTRNIISEIVEEIAEKPKGYNKYFSKQEQKLYDELTDQLEKTTVNFHKKRLTRKIKKLESLKKFNELHNKKLMGEILDDTALKVYNKGLRRFGDYVPLKEIEIKPATVKKTGLFKNKQAFGFTKQEEQTYKQLQANDKLIGLNGKYKQQYELLKEKEELSNLHEKMLDYRLNKTDSDNYIELYYKYKKEWKLPNLKLDVADKFTIKEPYFLNHAQRQDIKTISNKFKLTKKQQIELEDLNKKKFLNNGKLTPSQEKRLDKLLAQKDFNDLYSLRIQDKGLNYKNNKRYKQAYETLKKHEFKFPKDSEVDLFKDLTPKNQVVKIEWKEPTNGKYKHLKGAYDDGLTPELRNNFDDYFTIDCRNLTPHQKEHLDKWLFKEHKKINEFLRMGDGDIYKFTKKYIEKNELDLKKDWNKVMEIAKERKYTADVIEDLLNKNCLKKPLTGYRRQDNHYLTDYLPKGEKIVPGKTIVPLKGITSVAVTEEGATYYVKKAGKTDAMKWLLEIEMPTGTRGSYVSHVTIDKYKPEMEYLLRKDTMVKIMEFDEKNHYARLRVVNKYGR